MERSTIITAMAALAAVLTVRGRGGAPPTWRHVIGACLAALVALVGVVVASPAGAATEDASVEVAPLLEAGGDVVPNSYIVVLDVEPGPQGQAIVGDAVDRAEALGAEIRHEFSTVLLGYSAQLTPEQLETLRQDPAVSYIEENGIAEGHAEEEPSGDAVQNNPPSYGLDRIDQRQLPLDNRYEYNLDGTGVTVYVLDSGLNANHTDFTGRVAGGRNFLSGESTSNWADCHGHGTHTSGTAVGITFGVAKNARVFAVRVLGCNNRGAWDDSIAAFDWVAAQSGTRIINYSVGGGRTTSIEQAVTRVRRAGVLVSISAGNDNANACNQSPAASRDGITVGSTNDNDNRSTYSNWGSCVDIFAPGNRIPSARHDNDTGSIQFSGTSMSAPHVAGIGALYLQANPSATPDQVEQAIINAATTGVVNDPNGSPNRMAYSLGFGSGPPSPPPPAPGDLLEDFESASGWQVNPANSDTATTGQWGISDPAQSPLFEGGGPYQLGTTTSGTRALITDGRAGTAAGTYDVDGGVTTIRSPQYALPAGASSIGMSYYFGHRSNATSDDQFNVTVISGGERTSVFSRPGTASDNPAAWGSTSFDVTRWAGQTIQLEISVSDNGSASLIEAAVDDITLSVADDPPPPPPPDPDPDPDPTPPPPDPDPTPPPPTLPPWVCALFPFLCR